MAVSDRHCTQKLDVEGVIHEHLSPTTTFSARYTTVTATYSRIRAMLDKNNDPDTGAVPQNPGLATDQDLPPAYTAGWCQSPHPLQSPWISTPSYGRGEWIQRSQADRHNSDCHPDSCHDSYTDVDLGVIQFAATPGADSQP